MTVVNRRNNYAQSVRRERALSRMRGAYYKIIAEHKDRMVLRDTKWYNGGRQSKGECADKKGEGYADGCEGM